MNPPPAGQSVYDNGGEDTPHGAKTDSPPNGVGIKPGHSLKPQIRINSKWTSDLNVKTQKHKTP